MKAMRAWAIYHGFFYSDGSFSGMAFKTKKSAIKWIKENGFKYNKSENLYINDDVDNGNGTFGQWYRIEEMDFIKNKNWC